ncbi:ABC transporter permease [Lederbergia sp. NSJ-179]|uniref:FtsX-like permease family protein n=1 Tax=Lederbergia sp. NSJ-179 TaxID=2931402 RepID=UPI001FD4FBAD|nr:FtsX-like permease family protein [Lederbergia sp. NSJ-179]MCJ7842329.1 ABC transporter permease [Lederbergia sp. NSJ-179]
MVSKLWQLSLKMLFVKKGRSLFSILAIALSVGLLCSMFQLHMMFNQDLQQRFKDEYGSADIRISSAPPLDGDEWSGLDTSILEEIYRFEQIRSVGLALEGKMAGRILYENQGAVMDDTEFHYVGVDNARLTKEYYKFEQDLSDYEAALSKSLADRWNVAVSDSITIDLLSGGNVTWRVAEVVQSTKNTGKSVEDWVFFHLPSLQEVLGLSEIINPVLIEFEPGTNVALTGSELKSQLPAEVRVDALHGLEEEGEQYLFFRVFGYILSIIAFIASMILVYGMMQTTYRERLRELAVIRAVGGSPEQLMKMVIYEWAIIGAIGSLLGFFFAWLFSDRGVAWASRLLHLELIVDERSSGGIGMVIIALGAWLVVLLASLGIVRKVRHTEPVQSFRESLDNADDQADAYSGKSIWWLVCTVIGLLFWVASFFLSSINTSIAEMNMKALFSMIGGLLLIIAMLSMTVWLGVSLLRFITLLPERMTSRLFRLSAQRLMVERSQMFPVILMALIIAIYIPVATLFQFMNRPDAVSLADRLKADFFISAHQEISFSPEMPWYLKHEMEGIEWVEKVLPLPSSRTAKLNDHDTQATSTSVDHLISYGVTDLQELAEWDLVSLPDDIVEDAGVLPQDLANELGIKIGDSLPFVVDDQSTSVTIVDIIDKMDQFHLNQLLIAESHPDFKPNGLDEILVNIKDGYDEHMKQHLQLLQREYPEMRWIQTAEATSTFETTRQQALAMLQGITVIVTVAGIGGVLNALNAGIHARRREYAVLRSIYLTPFQMMKLVAWQGVILAVLSLFIGTITAAILLISVYISSSGFKGIFDHIPFENIGVLYFILFVLSVLSTIPMAGKIARMSIMDVFKAAG